MQLFLQPNKIRIFGKKNTVFIKDNKCFSYFYLWFPFEKRVFKIFNDATGIEISKNMLLNVICDLRTDLYDELKYDEVATYFNSLTIY